MSILNHKMILVTGGAGFIGSNLIKHFIRNTPYSVLNLDKLTYAGNTLSLKEIEQNSRYQFVQGDISDSNLIQRILKEAKPFAVMNLAAETHVDRSIDGPAEFIKTNIMGTFTLLEACLEYWKEIGCPESFRFHHISTDEVYGSLGSDGKFSEVSPYDPSSPYSASKASSDHLVRSWFRTYGLPILVTNCSNNYGPFQYPEKLIPLMIKSALEGKSLPVYGDGLQIRDWLFVEDHARALQLVLEKGKVGETYNVGGDAERYNLDVVKSICTYLDEILPNSKFRPHSQLIQHVKDRPGHDRRYAIDCSKLKDELGWSQCESFESGLKKTVKWFIENKEWSEAVLSNKYHGERLGTR